MQTQHDGLEDLDVAMEEIQIEAPEKAFDSRILVAFFVKLRKIKQRITYGMLMDMLKHEKAIAMKAIDLEVGHHIHKLPTEFHHFVCDAGGNVKPRAILFFKEDWEKEVSSNEPMKDWRVYKKFRQAALAIIAKRA